MKIPTTKRSAAKIAADFEKEANSLIGQGKSQYNEALRSQKEAERKMAEGRHYAEVARMLKWGKK